MKSEIRYQIAKIKHQNYISKYKVFFLNVGLSFLFLYFDF